jgi:hypothetical protein
LCFDFYPLRFEFTALEPIFFPYGKASNILRGAFGVIFRKIACIPQCTDAKTCALRDSCPYARVFEPVSQGDSPSGLADWPRPFVFRARHLDGQTIHTGESFSFGLNLFSPEHTVIAYFVLTFASLAREGLGPSRGKARLDRVLCQDHAIYSAATQTISAQIHPRSLPLTPDPNAPAHIRVVFLTPTELKHNHQIAATPEFPILFSRVRDRIATLSRLYTGKDLGIDFQGTNARAAEIRMTAFRSHYQSASRRSTKTRQSHEIGGFIGEADYEGDLGEFLPYLEAASWTGVGRQSVWGKGEIRVERLDTPVVY